MNVSRSMFQDDGDSSPEAELVEKLSSLSEQLTPIMKRAGLSLQFSPVSADGLCVVDDTKNPANTFKVRGALASAQLAKEGGARMLIAASAGNHGAGVAYAGFLLGLAARIYVPKNASQAKVDLIESFGAKAVQEGANFDECLQAAYEDPSVLDGSAKFIHPFDDLTVAAGQGTIGEELLMKLPELLRSGVYNSVRVFLPIGGGGLAAGVSSRLRSAWPDHFPPLEIIGVIDESAPASLLGTLFGRPVQVVPDTIADGTRVALVGATFLSVSHLIDKLLLVPHDAIVETMRYHRYIHGEELEGAGALAKTGEMMSQRYKLFTPGISVLRLPIVTGANIQSGVFETAMTERARINRESHTRVAFDVCMEEKQGELLRFLSHVRDYNIASLTYKQNPSSTVATVRVEFEITHQDSKQLEGILEQAFSGTKLLREGEQMLYEIGAPLAATFSDRLIRLEDKPGAFYHCVSELCHSGSLGNVGFLFYRQPAKPGGVPQVILGNGTAAE